MNPDFLYSRLYLYLISIVYNRRMPSIPQKEWGRAISLYESGLAMREVSEYFNVSIDTVTYILRKMNVPRRSFTEANQIKFAQKPLSFKLREPLSTREEKIKIAGVLLYWAEGYKTNLSKSVDFANSDPEMILAFLNFLRIICGVDEKRLRVYLYCHDADRQEQRMEYWSIVTKIPLVQFTKPYIAKSIAFLNTMPNGLIHIRYSDKKLLNLIRLWIQEFKEEYCVGGGVVNRNRL